MAALEFGRPPGIMRFGSVVVAAWGVTIVAASTGCAMRTESAIEHLADSQYRLKCKAALPRCLERAEELCKGNRYTVLSAIDEHDYLGPQGLIGQEEARASEAVVRCGARGKTLWGPNASASASTTGVSSEPAAAEASPGAPGSVTPRVCIPGATQACVGPAACRGGQSCAPDGARFSPCDCGNSAATGSVTAPAAGSPPPAPPPIVPPP